MSFMSKNQYSIEKSDGGFFCVIETKIDDPSYEQSFRFTSEAEAKAFIQNLHAEGRD
jgi:hypothetical protein